MRCSAREKWPWYGCLHQRRALSGDPCLPVLRGQVSEGDLMRDLDQIEPALQVCRTRAKQCGDVHVHSRVHADSTQPADIVHCRVKAGCTLVDWHSTQLLSVRWLTPSRALC